MSKLLPGCRKATQLDSQAAFKRVDEITGTYGYSVGVTGSTLLGEGNDIDLIVVASMDARYVSARRVANAVLSRMSHMLLEYEEFADDGSCVAVVFQQRNQTVVDLYVVGYGEDA